MNKILATLVLTSILLVPTIMSAYAYSGSGSATGSVTIAGTCGVSLGSSAISFGSVVPGTTAAPATAPLGLNNTGSVVATLSASAGNWTSSGTTYINANQTQFSTTGTSGPWTSFALSSNTPTLVTSTFSANPAPHTSSSTTYWQLIPKVLSNFAGSLTQSLTFTASC